MKPGDIVVSDGFGTTLLYSYEFDHDNKEALGYDFSDRLVNVSHGACCFVVAVSNRTSQEKLLVLAPKGIGWSFTSYWVHLA